jgi:hypothetical protein
MIIMIKMTIYKAVIIYKDTMTSKSYDNINSALSYLDNAHISNLINEMYITKDDIIINQYLYKSFNRQYYIIDKDIIDEFDKYIYDDDDDIFDESYRNGDNFIIDLCNECGESVKKFSLKKKGNYNKILVSV